jgi:ribosomal protein S27E
MKGVAKCFNSAETQVLDAEVPESTFDEIKPRECSTMLLQSLGGVGRLSSS